MEIDPKTFEDLSIFAREGEFSVFRTLNYTSTNGGKDALHQIFQHPLSDISSIVAMQGVIRYLVERQSRWTVRVTNGTIIMIGEYRKSQIGLSSGRNLLEFFLFRTVKAGDLSFLRYSLVHISDLLRGMMELVRELDDPACPTVLKTLLDQAGLLLSGEACREIASTDFNGRVPVPRVLRFDYFVRGIFRQKLEQLIRLYYRLDAWHSMAIAMDKHRLVFPEFISGEQPGFRAAQLYHILLPDAVGNDIGLETGNNFLFLTGANMSGKSTLIKAIGIAAYLAHLGLGVPAKSLELSLMNGILSNIQVQDNILMGESYFYNEVQRVKNTIAKVAGGKRWLILVDELFKGTNIEDARNCSIAVIRGLSRVRDSLFVLSTHLYEIGEDLRDLPHLMFRYLESGMEGGAFHFNYRLKEGISKDRLGYLILKREHVLEMLAGLERDTGIDPGS